MITVVIINMCNYRYVMSWTHQQSSLLSLLLDEVVGTDRITVVIINMCNYRYVMSWTHQQSSLLSLLLDEVVGT